MLTKADLIADGCVPNPNMWIGDGWLYCRTCERFQFHGAWSHPGETDCHEVCKVCDTYTGKLKLKGTPMTTATDILENAAELTRRYGKTVAGISGEVLGESESPTMQGISRPTPPARVYVLMHNGTVLGVLSTEQRALDEANSFMAAKVGIWQPMAGLMWRSGTDIVAVNPHDVR